MNKFFIAALLLFISTISMVSAQCPALFTYTTNLADIHFYNQSNSGYSSAWDFGDGSPIDTAFYPGIHHYVSAGDYIVCYTHYNGTCSSTFCDTVHVLKTACEASFNSVLNGNILHVQNQSITTAISYHWDLGDGTLSDSFTIPAHLYTVKDTYLVCLTVTDSFCTSTNCDTLYITNTACDAHFHTNIADNKVTFINQSIGDAFCFWEFGDGGSSSKCDSPVHYYSAIGKYEVCLTVYDTACQHTYCDSVTISKINGLQTPAMIYNFTCYPNPAGDWITLTLPKFITLNQITVSTTLGQSQSIIQSPTSTKLYVGQLQPGLYFISGLTKDGFVYRSSFIKQ